VGRRVALDLGAQGMAVALAAVSVEDLDEVAAELEATGGQALVVPSDVTDRDSVQSMVGRVEGSLGPVDLLVTVAEPRGPAVEFLSGDPDQWWRVVEGALRGPALCAHYALKRMVPRRRGRIVNVLGEWSLGAAPVLSELACSEAAVLRLTDSLALASWTYGISVFAVSAGRAAIEAGPDPDEGGVAGAPAGLQLAGQLVSELASGRADRLTGRFIRVGDDLAELVRRSDQVEAEDCLQLRLLELQPAPPEELAAGPESADREIESEPPEAPEPAPSQEADSPRSVDEAEPAASEEEAESAESEVQPEPAESPASDRQPEAAEPAAPDESAGSKPPTPAKASPATVEP
jgi:NAD(P)-dependent dehydrogenase (short-subunit alcohol dehydrogenase family)